MNPSSGPQFRRTADGIYNDVTVLADTLSGTEAYEALESELRGLRQQIETNPPAEMHEVVNAFSRKLNMEGASKVKSGMSKVRRALKKKKPDLEKALKEFDKAEKLYTEQLQWRGPGQRYLHRRGIGLSGRVA